VKKTLINTCWLPVWHLRTHGIHYIQSIPAHYFYNMLTHFKMMSVGNKLCCN